MNVGVMKDYKLRDLRASHTHKKHVPFRQNFVRGKSKEDFFYKDKRRNDDF
jgi:hypothetical protein